MDRTFRLSLAEHVRNRDKELGSGQARARHPVTIVLDNVRSVHNVGHDL